MRRYLYGLVEAEISYRKNDSFLKVLSTNNYEKNILPNIAVHNFISEVFTDQVSLYRNTEMRKTILNEISKTYEFNPKIRNVSTNDILKQFNNKPYKEIVLDIIENNFNKEDKEIKYFIYRLIEHKTAPNNLNHLIFALVNLNIKRNVTSYIRNIKIINSKYKKIIIEIDNGLNKKLRKARKR